MELKGHFQILNAFNLSKNDQSLWKVLKLKFEIDVRACW